MDTSCIWEAYSVVVKRFHEGRRESERDNVQGMGPYYILRRNVGQRTKSSSLRCPIDALSRCEWVWGACTHLGPEAGGEKQGGHRSKGSRVSLHTTIHITCHERTLNNNGHPYEHPYYNITYNRYSGTVNLAQYRRQRTLTRSTLYFDSRSNSLLWQRLAHPRVFLQQSPLLVPHQLMETGFRRAQ